MDRKDFLKKGLMGLGAAAAASVAATGNTAPDQEEQAPERVGYNHIPNEEITTMKSVLHRAHTRGHANHGWLDSHHSFSFANYHNPERMHFGVLRVLNDDIVAGGHGFPQHPHDNMEIISVPLAGALEHQDSMGNKHTIKAGDIQVMSAGTGVFHSEYNRNEGEETRFLQIWVFPNQRDVEPRYDQITLPAAADGMQQILSPNPDDAGVWVHQNAWFHRGRFDAETSGTYTLKDPTNGVYIFMIEGAATVGQEMLGKRDGYGVWDIKSISYTAKPGTDMLVMEVPMALR